MLIIGNTNAITLRYTTPPVVKTNCVVTFAK